MQKVRGYVVNCYVLEEDYKDLLAFKKAGIPYAEVLRIGLSELRKRESGGEMLVEEKAPQMSRMPLEVPRPRMIPKEEPPVIHSPKAKEMPQREQQPISEYEEAEIMAAETLTKHQDDIRFYEVERGLTLKQAQTLILYNNWSIKEDHLMRILGIKTTNGLDKGMEDIRKKLKEYGEEVPFRTKGIAKKK